MKHVKTLLRFYVTFSLLRRVRWRLVHDHHKMPALMVLQQLIKKVNDLRGCDSLIVQRKDQLAGLANGRHGGDRTTSARHFFGRRFSHRGPRLAQKSGQGNAGFVLKITTVRL